MDDQAAGVVVGSIDVAVEVVEGRVDKVVSIVMGRSKQVADVESGGKAGVEEGACLKGVKVNPNLFGPAVFSDVGGVRADAT